MDSSLRRCLSKALLESGKKLTGRLPVTLMLAYNVPRYFQRCHRHAGDASSWPRRRGNDSGTTILVKMALNGARRESLCKIRAMNKFRTRVFFLWIIRMFFFFFEEVYWREERRDYVCFRDNKMRIFFDRNISFDPFNFLFSSSSSFVSRVSLFLSLSRIKENIEVIVSFYCKKIKFKLVSRLIIIYSA